MHRMSAYILFTPLLFGFFALRIFYASNVECFYRLHLQFNVTPGIVFAAICCNLRAEAKKPEDKREEAAPEDAQDRRTGCRSHSSIDIYG